MVRKLTVVVRAVVFDVGETLVADDRHWGTWASWLGVPMYTLSALVGAVTALGMDNAEALRLLRPGLDVAAEQALREVAGAGEVITDDDVYPDVRPALGALRDAGWWVGVAGNQTPRVGELLRRMGLPVDAVATSGEWGVAKPERAFFSRVLEWAGVSRPDDVVYVGDHPANDIFPAKEAGLRTALIRRGPWGHLWWSDPQVVAAVDWRVTGLAELVRVLPVPDTEG